MLQIRNIKKKYKTGDLIQTALDDVSLNLRDNEFVAILGPSGSGKTTLLNIIGGLDRYDSGDLIINDISTKKYKSRDWDAYRNHTIGFVFQSYNLIPHQNILSNVELALTISGVSRSERKKRAKQALEKVGLGNQFHKRPNQLSGGQMQRVAIARALVNNPDILLADEPTGALDTETGIQVMELLKEVAKDRLVVMVTHNPELAEEYATRIVKLRDGKIKSDSNPYEPEKTEKEPVHKKLGKASMSFLTSLALSFNNLRTKKGRTILTSFAGSIGIIGIALILSLSNGVNTYITDIQKSTMSSYPITIDAKTMDLSSIMNIHEENIGDKEIDHQLDQVYSDNQSLEMISEVTASITKNNLTKFKEYLDNPKSDIHQYLGENGVVYTYQTRFGVYTKDSDGTFVNTDGSTLTDDETERMAISSNKRGMAMSMSFMSDYQSNTNFTQILPGKNGKGISDTVKENYDLLYGEWPGEYNDVVLILDENNEISTTALYAIGFLPTKEYKDIVKKIENNEKVELKDRKWSYKDICQQDLYLIPDCDTYIKSEDGKYECVKENTEKMEKLMNSAVKLNISAVIRPKEDAVYTSLDGVFGYTQELTDYIINVSNNSDVVKAQKNSKDINIINGVKFAPSDDDAKIEDLKSYVDSLGVSEKAALTQQMITATGGDVSEVLQQAQQPQTSANPQQAQQPQTSTNPQQAQQPQTSTNPQQAQQLQTSTNPQQAQQPQANMNPQQSQASMEEMLAAMLDDMIAETDKEILVAMYDQYISSGTYEDNLETFGVISLDAPTSINIYTDSFDAKDSVSECIEKYNSKVDQEDQITYTDYVGLLMSSVTTIVNVISYVLIAFVAVSLIVSSIMIGIITYISVLERTKEIGILRAIGASKRNISQVFNAETFIIGLFSGLMGIGINLLLLIPINMLIHSIAGTDTVNAILPLDGGIILVVLSVILTLIGGLIPSKKAANKDPVTALRTE